MFQLTNLTCFGIWNRYLCCEPYPQENLEFLRANNIKLLQFGIEGKSVIFCSSLQFFQGCLHLLLQPLSILCIFCIWNKMPGICAFLLIVFSLFPFFFSLPNFVGIDFIYCVTVWNLSLILLSNHLHLQEPSVSMPRDTIMEALKVLIGMNNVQKNLYSSLNHVLLVFHFF